ncbi:MAG: MgtC/SapB family protein [Terracidiphilus sp.]|nr:MgtC/SapB family protein [Terracidiphilus sp.]
MVEFFPETPMYVERMAIALLYGCLIGLERQWQHGMAGIRTHGLVAVGGAAFVACGLLIPGGATAPARVASYVVSGVGFLCAGSIFRDGATVKGLNTAATIWCAAAVGLLTGFGNFMLGMAMTVLVMATNACLRPLAHKWHPWAKNQPVDAIYEVRVSCGEFIEEHVRTLLVTAISQAPVRLRAVHCVQTPASGQVEVTAEIITEGDQPREVERIAATLSMEPATRDIRWGLIPPVASGATKPAGAETEKGSTPKS